VKPHSHLTMQWRDPTTFHKVSAALRFPPSYVSALYHASGHAETSTFIRRGEDKKYIGTKVPIFQDVSLTKLTYQAFWHRIRTIIGILGHLQSATTLRLGSPLVSFAQSKREELMSMQSLRNSSTRPLPRPIQRCCL